MIDYSFLRLKNSLSSALYTAHSPVAEIVDHSFIQLIPSKAYCQITNYEGGISLNSDCSVYVVNCSDKELAEITDNVFISDFTDHNGNNQCAIEFVNLNKDFYREKVLIKFKMKRALLCGLWNSSGLNRQSLRRYV